MNMAEDEVEGIFSHDCPLGCVYYTIVNINPDKSGQSNFLAKRFLNEKKLLELYPTIHPLVLWVHCLFTLSTATTHQYCIQNSACHVHTSNTHWIPWHWFVMLWKHFSFSTATPSLTQTRLQLPTQVSLHPPVSTQASLSLSAQSLLPSQLPNPTSSPTSGSPTGAIIGGVVGFLGFVALIVIPAIIACYIFKTDKYGKCFIFM